MRRTIPAIGLALLQHFALGQNQIGAGSDPTAPIIFRTTIDGPFAFTSGVGIGGSTPDHQPAAVKFKYTGATPTNSGFPSPNFVVVSPSSGITRATILIGLNANIVRSMNPGSYWLSVNFSTIDQNPPSQATAFVYLGLGTTPPAITSIVNSASLQPSLSPGAMVSIFGIHLGPLSGSTAYDDTGTYPSAIGDPTSKEGTVVTFNGTPAPLVYVSPGQINATVPYHLAGQKSANVIVTRYGHSSTAFTVPVLETSPAIFTATSDGTGQGAILNFAFSGPTYNSASNPAPKGSAIEIFATGQGVWNPAAPDRAIALAANSATFCAYPPCRAPVAPISPTIGGRAATILYAGSAPFQP